MVAERSEQRPELAAVPRLCRRGLHELTPNNVVVFGNGKQTCRPCRRVTNRASDQRTARKSKTVVKAPEIAHVSKDSTSPLPAPVRGLQAAPGVFAAIAARQAEHIAAAKAQGPTPWAASLRAGEQAVRLRVIRERGPSAERVDPEAIVAATADAFGVTVADLTGKCRDLEISWPRQLCMWAIREWVPGVSFITIGKHLGGRDHTTVMYGYDKITRLVEAGDDDTLRDLDYLREALQEMGAAV